MPYRVLFLGTYLLCLINILQYAKQVSGADDFSGWKAGNYPDPVLDPQACGLPTITKDNTAAGATGTNIVTHGNNTAADNTSFTWVCDPDSVLFEYELTNLVDLIKECHSDAPCGCTDNCTNSGGYIIAVAVVDRLNTEGEFQPMKIKAKIFAEEVRKRWFENYECEDNVLLFYTWHANKLYISLGSEVEKVISDIELAKLYETGRKYFVKKPQTDLEDDAEKDPRLESNITRTFLGMDALVRQTHAGIMNGSSVTSRMVFSITIPILLMLTLTIMCLISNCCCAQDFLYDPTADKYTMDRMIR